MRNKGGSDAVLEADLAGLSSSNGGEIKMGGEKKGPVDQKTGGGSGGGGAPIGGGGDSGNGGAFAGKNGGLGPLGLANPFAETPGIGQNTNTHWNEELGSSTRIMDLEMAVAAAFAFHSKGQCQVRICEMGRHFFLCFREREKVKACGEME